MPQIVRFEPYTAEIGTISTTPNKGRHAIRMWAETSVSETDFQKLMAGSPVRIQVKNHFGEMDCVYVLLKREIEFKKFETYRTIQHELNYETLCNSLNSVNSDNVHKLLG